MNIWIISDTHFGHKFMVEAGIRKPYYEREMWESINRNVKSGDLLIHLGDVAFTHTTEVGQALTLIPGNKVLIRGNHDHGFEKYFKMGFNTVADDLTLEYGGEVLHFSHEPRLIFRGTLNIHGHLHGDNHRLQADLEWYKNSDRTRYIDMAPEVWGYGVIPLDSILKLLRKDALIWKK